MQRGLAGRDGECTDAAFELGDALLKHGRGRVGDAAVAIAFDFEIEQRGAVIGAVERIGYRLIDRHGDGLGRWIGLVAGVDSERLTAHDLTRRSIQMVISSADNLPEGSATSTLAAGTRSSSNQDWLRAIDLTATIAADPSRLLADVVQQWAEKAGDRAALLSDRETLSY